MRSRTGSSAPAPRGTAPVHALLQHQAAPLEPPLSLAACLRTGDGVNHECLRKWCKIPNDLTTAHTAHALLFVRSQLNSGVSRTTLFFAVDYEIIEAADADELGAAVLRGIRAADPPDVGPRDWRPLALALRAPDGELVGGLYGATMWGWLLVDGLWVAETLRGQGQGRRLLLAAEGEGRERGCRGARLGTFDFQARTFYERLGYRVLGELPGFPAGHTHYELWKTFEGASGDNAHAAPSRAPARGG